MTYYGKRSSNLKHLAGGEDDSPLHGNAKEISEKYDKLSGLLVNSLKVMEKMAVTMDSLPALMQHVIQNAGIRKKVMKQEYNFESLIKDLMDEGKDFRIRKSDINLSSFGSYFKKVIKKQPAEGKQRRPSSHSEKKDKVDMRNPLTETHLG